ncbi:MAG: hypothetical protein II922_05615 [Succinimonas sp.]|nr:hypothetical protein [Succinimonas sp.]
MMLMTPAALMLALFSFAGCSGSGKGASEDLGPVDYSLAERWLSRPDITKEADVFYLYPTLYNGSETEPDYAAIDNREMLETAELTYDRAGQRISGICQHFCAVLPPGVPGA